MKRPRLPRGATPDATSRHVRAARDGDSLSVDWLIRRFTPLLLAQARYRIAAVPRAAVDADDLVQETWAVALPRLAQIIERDGRTTPVLMRFLGETLLRLLNNAVRREIRRTTAGWEDRQVGSASAVAGRVVAGELRDAVLDAIDRLPERDRAVIVLRAVEGLGNAEAAALLGESPNAVSLRYNRVLAALRNEFDESIFDDL